MANGWTSVQPRCPFNIGSDLAVHRCTGGDVRTSTGHAKRREISHLSTRTSAKSINSQREHQKLFNRGSGALTYRRYCIVGDENKLMCFGCGLYN